MAPVLPGAPENYPEPVRQTAAQMSEAAIDRTTAGNCVRMSDISNSLSTDAAKLEQESSESAARQRRGFTSQREMAASIVLMSASLSFQD